MRSSLCRLSRLLAPDVPKPPIEGHLVKILMREWWISNLWRFTGILRSSHWLHQKNLRHSYSIPASLCLSRDGSHNIQLVLPRARSREDLGVDILVYIIYTHVKVYYRKFEIIDGCAAAEHRREHTDTIGQTFDASEYYTCFEQADKRQVRALLSLNICRRWRALKTIYLHLSGIVTTIIVFTSNIYDNDWLSERHMREKQRRSAVYTDRER